MPDILTYGLLVITSFFTLINPIGTMPVFLSLTADFDHHHRKAVLKRALIASFIILLCFAFSGQFLFRFFNISVNSFRIVGGAIFFVIGFDMLNARMSGTKVKQQDVKQYARDISITPLAIPMLCGPGAITNGIVLMEDAHTWALKGVFIAGVLIVMMCNYVILASSSRLVKVLGDTGINVMMRLMGLILMVIAVEFFIAGIKPFLVSVIHGT